jgi:glycosyltransferase involved in cell wall biosynthesis
MAEERRDGRRGAAREGRRAMTQRRAINVAVITPNPTPYRVPFFRELALGGDIRLTVFFLTKGSPSRPWNVELGGFDHEFLPEWSLPAGGKDGARYRINPSVISRLRRLGPDVVVISGYNHFTTQAVILYCIATGTPWCLMSESHIAKPRGAVRVLAKKLLLGPILRTMSAAMVTGTLARRYVESFGIPGEAIFVVANTPDIAYFTAEAERLAPERDRIRRGLSIAGKKAILFVGRLLDEKGLAVLFEAYEMAGAKRGDLALLVVGDGVRRPRYEQIVREKGLRDVHFLGFKAQGELPEIYSAADVFVLPSLVEPWGVVVNEAMACGLPVIVSDQVGASADLVEEGGNGFIVPAGAAEPLADRMLEVLCDENRRLAMGRHSVEIVSKWDYSSSVDNFLAAADKAASRKGHRP